MADQRNSSGRIDAFIAQDPNVPRYNQRLSAQQWADLEPLISELHHQGTTQNKMLEILRQKTISITKAQLHHQMMKWGLRTYKRNETNIQEVTTRESPSCRREVESTMSAGSVEIVQPMTLYTNKDGHRGPSCGVAMSLGPQSLPSDSTMTDSAISVEDMASSGENSANVELSKPVSPFEGEERLRFSIPRYEVMDSRVATILSLYNNKKEQVSFRVQVEKLSKAATVLFVLDCHDLSFDFFYQVLFMLNDVEIQDRLSRLWLANSAINCARFWRTGPQRHVAEVILPQLWLWLQRHTLFDRTELRKKMLYKESLSKLLRPAALSEDLGLWAVNAMPIHFGCTTGVRHQQEFNFSEATSQEMLDHCFECADLKDTLAQALRVIQDFTKDFRDLLSPYLEGICRYSDVKNPILCLNIMEQVDRYCQPCLGRGKSCCFHETTSPIFFHATYAVPALFAVIVDHWYFTQERSIDNFLEIVKRYQPECFGGEQHRQYRLMVHAYMSQWTDKGSRALMRPDTDPEMDRCTIERVSTLSGLLSGEEVKSLTDTSAYVTDRVDLASERRMARSWAQDFFLEPVSSGGEELLPPIAPSCTSSVSSGFRSFKKLSKSFGSFRGTFGRSILSESSEGREYWASEYWASGMPMEYLIAELDDAMESI